MMRAALLLVDLQNDFLNRSALTPARDSIVTAAAALLEKCRSLGLPVLHVHTSTRADGTDRMPHWIAHDIHACVAGTPGIEPPPSLQPLPQEHLFHKSFYSAFEHPDVAQTLHALRIDTLVVAGIYTHGCVRASVLDAYAHGFEVWVAEQAVASTEPVHAELSRDYLQGRAATFLDSNEILERLGKSPRIDVPVAEHLPVACIMNTWQGAAGRAHYLHRNPGRLSDMPARVSYATRADVAQAGAAARAASPGWQGTDLAARIGLLQQWQRTLQQQAGVLIDAMVVEIGKPEADAQEEFQRALAHIGTALRLAETEIQIDEMVSVRYQPLGCVGIITPWNNPLAIPVAKIAAALVFGNSIVWKPACQAARTSQRLLESLIEAGLPAGVAGLVFGDAGTVRHMIRDPGIDAITLTGSVATGRSVSALCSIHGKPLQAELGGNNAVIVLADADLAREAEDLARSAFSFAGQRCTAIRRFVVDQSIAAEFESRLTRAAAGLRLPPLISEQHVQRVDTAVRQAVEQEGARLLCGGRQTGGGDDCRYAASLITDVAAESNIVQEETFGPVAVIQRAQDLDEAISLVNRVPQGLLAGLLSGDPAASKHFCSRVEAGILKLGAGSLAVHPEAPFGGWKASQAGPPEHGVWDRAFYTRPQAVYR